MKIIHQGTIPETVPVRATCGNCRTVFDFLPSEARRINDQRDGDFYTVDCPVCGRPVNRDVRSKVGGHWHD